jgi:FMN phosphatase YigB (HAD superfamily)
MTREMNMWKPSPDPFLNIMNRFKCKSNETFTIGDSHYDVLASRQAAISNIFIIKNSKPLQLKDTSDLVFFSDFFELKNILKISLI